MFAYVVPMAINLVLVAAVAVWWLSRRWPDQQAEFRRLAGRMAVGASVANELLVLILVLDPDLIGWDGPYLMLFAVSMFVPSMCLIGAIRLWRGRRARMFVVSALIWIAVTGLGVAGSVLG
jgi:hypothetical protein